jgi:hypothetical protein
MQRLMGHQSKPPASATQVAASDRTFFPLIWLKPRQRQRVS